MADQDPTDSEELAQLVKRIDRHRRARLATDAISEHSTRALYANQGHLRLLQAVAIAANESSSLDDALLSAVDQICTMLGWPIGHAYLTITEILALSDIWYVADLQRYAAFRRAVETTALPADGGLPGQAIARRAPLWTDKVPPAAANAGLRSAIEIPIVGDLGVVAVLEFFYEQAEEPDRMLIEVMGKIGELLGKVHIRTKTEATLRSSQ